jgi:hypothetical protein
MLGPLLLSILSGIRYITNYFLQQKNVMTSSMISNHESASSSSNSPPEKSSTASSMLKSTLRYVTWLDPVRGSVEGKTMNIESGTVLLFAVLICGQ